MKKVVIKILLAFGIVGVRRLLEYKVKSFKIRFFDGSEIDLKVNSKDLFNYFAAHSMFFSTNYRFSEVVTELPETRIEKFHLRLPWGDRKRKIDLSEKLVISGITQAMLGFTYEWVYPLSPSEMMFENVFITSYGIR